LLPDLLETSRSATEEIMEHFESSAQTANIWLKEIAAALGTESRREAYAALRAVLHALRDRLPVNECAQFAAELPLAVKGVYFDGWTPSGKPLKMDRAQFLAAIEQNSPRLADPEAELRAVVGVLARHISVGELDDVQGNMPKDLRELLESIVHPERTRSCAGWPGAESARRELAETLEQVRRIERPRRGLGVVLHAHDGQFRVAHALDRAVVQVRVRLSSCAFPRRPSGTSSDRPRTSGSAT
jgi:uncharacterized protein (DUF2267 family)